MLARKFRHDIRYLCLLVYRHRFWTVFILMICGLFNSWEHISYSLYLLTINIEQHDNSVTIWSTDYHISPIYDLKNLLIPYGVHFIDKSLSDNCHETSSCAQHLRILTKSNGINPSDQVRRRFYEFYKAKLEMNVVDAFVCFHPSSMCELYIPFNRSIIVIATTRYELGRFAPNEWKQWNSNLQKIAKDPKNLVAANNLYDTEYIRYFTGLNVTLLPSFCGYTNEQYKPTRKEFLLSPIHSHNFEPIFLKQLNESLYRFGLNKIVVVRIRDMYERYKYSDLANHPAIIHVPYQVSIMSLFEQYRMCIPLFFPSLNLLTQWQYEFGVVEERTWDNVNYARKPNGSNIKGVLPGIPDPNNEFDREAIRYWLNFSDFYQWPYIVHYHSTDDLVKKLRSTDFQGVSVKMRRYNQQVRDGLVTKWKIILENIRRYSKKLIKQEGV